MVKVFDETTPQGVCANEIKTTSIREVALCLRTSCCLNFSEYVYHKKIVAIYKEFGACIEISKQEVVSVVSGLNDCCLYNEPR